MKVVIVLGLITFLLNQHPNHALRLFGASSFTTAKGKAAHYLATSAGHSLKSFKHVQSHQKLLQTLSSSSSIRSQSHLFMISEQSHAPTLQDSFEQFEQLAGKPLPPADEPVLVNEATQTHQQPEEASTPITTIPEESATTASTVSANADNGNNNSEIDQDLIVTVDTNVDPTTTATAPLTAVAPVEPPKQTMPQPQVHRELSVFIGLIPRNVTEDVLKQIIATRIGEDIQIVRMAIPTVKTGHVRGSAFVQFVNAEAREQAFQRLQGLVIEGHKMKVDYGERSMDKIGKRDSANRALVQARYQQNQFQSNAAAMGMISSYPYNAPMPMYYPQAYYPPPPAGAYPGPGGYYYPMPPQPMPMMPGYPQPYAPPQSYPQRQYQQQPPPQQYQQQQQPQYQQQPQQPQFQQYPPQDNYQQPGQENMRRMMRNRPPQRRNYYNDEYQYQKPARPQRELSDPKLSIYVANVPFSMTESNLKSLFQETTGIAPDDTTIVANRNDPTRKFAFIRLATEEAKNKALAEHQQLVTTDGVAIPLTQCMTKSHSIFIGNLAYDVGDDLLKEMLDDVIGPGRYISVKRAVDHAGRAKGFAWATFATSEQAQHAVTQLHELEMNGRTLMVTLGRTETANNGASSSNNVQSRTEHVPNQTTTITSEPAGNI